MNQGYKFLVFEIFTAVFLMQTCGKMFDFHLLEDYRNATTQEEICRRLGYDGFAVLSTPEAFKYALRLSSHYRSGVRSGIYIGAHYQKQYNLSLWDDGTDPRSDTPFYSYPPDAKPGRPVARIDTQGKLTMGGDSTERPAICGNHNDYSTESVGTTMPAELETTSRAILSVSKLFSHLECAVFCGLTYECRLAEFNYDLLTCTLVGEYTPSATVYNPPVITFVRQAFDP
ncbi:hypothetical protein ElyMa_003161800 [Elysia marginata]|uniref:Apple domain-containing protein n=1 Tax=Elysia marginata TaxID=1093978 RepID=A0AAV4J0U3_9GAST|nr:hypothetical protein ElyMa_003161800 [Elysia marginata]